MNETVATQTTAEILIAAKGRINQPSKWISYWSISADGRRVCALSAIQDAAKSVGVSQDPAIEALAKETDVNAMWGPRDRVVYFNGAKRHRDVMAAFDRAIDKAKAGDAA